MYSFQFERKSERVKDRKQKKNGKGMEQRKKRRKGKERKNFLLVFKFTLSLKFCF